MKKNVTKKYEAFAKAAKLDLSNKHKLLNLIEELGGTVNTTYKKGGIYQCSVSGDLYVLDEDMKAVRLYSKRKNHKYFLGFREDLDGLVLMASNIKEYIASGGKI